MRSYKFVHALLAVLVSALTLSGCRAIGTIFKAGVWTGIVAVVIVLAVVGGIIAMFSRRAA